MTSSPSLEKLSEAASAPLASWPDRFPGHRAVGYLCSYVPEELLHAAGFTPIRIRGSDAPLRHVDGHLQSYTCALCRSTLDQLLGGTLAFLEGTVFAHTCDAMQAQADLWGMNTTGFWVDTVMQPANLGARQAHTYLVAELNHFRQRLAARAGRAVEAGDIRAAIHLYNGTRDLVAKLHRVRERFTAPEYYQILDAAQTMPREVYNPLLAQVLVESGAVPSPPRPGDRRQGARIFLTGAVVDEPGLYRMIQALGAQVVGDDLCSGSRHFQDRVSPDGEPIANLASYHLRRPPCPAKFHTDHDPATHLLQQVESAQAQGVVFALLKFCEPHTFDFAAVLPALDHAGVPALLLEMEHTPSSEAIRTRLQAFIEML